MTQLYNDLSVPQLTLAAIDQFYTEAHALLQSLSLKPEAWAPLWEYAESLLGRKK